VRYAFAFALVCTCPAAAAAGGIDQSGQPVTLLFRDGNVVEMALGYWDPDIEGSDADGRGSGNVYGPITDLFAGVKAQVTDRLSLALVADEPYGVSVDYPLDAAGGAFPYAGTSGEPESLALTGLVRYRATDRISLHGGLRAERLGAEVTLNGPAYGPLAGYSWTGDDDWAVGAVAGASWEAPAIGLRVALTYASEIRHELDTSETLFLVSSDGLTTEITMPQSVNLDFQTGLSATTLLYGSVRWADWGGWQVAPPGFSAATGEPLLSFRSDTWTYRLGIGRQLTEALSAGLEIAHETAKDTMMSPLSPYDGYTALAIGAGYTLASGVTLRGSISQWFLGDADVATTVTPRPVRFEDSRATAGQLRISFAF